MSIDIENTQPRKVRANLPESFTPWGGCRDFTDVLTNGEIYQITKIEVHSWHTRLFLDGIDGYFSSTIFDEISTE